MELSPKKIRRFIAKLLQGSDEGTLTHKSIRQKFADHIGADESSLSRSVKKKLKALVSEVMIPATKVDGIKSTKSDTPQRVGNQETRELQSSHEQKHVTATSSDNSKVKCVVDKIKKKRTIMESSDSDRDSGDEEKHQTTTNLAHVNRTDNTDNEKVRNANVSALNIGEMTTEVINDVHADCDQDLEASDDVSSSDKESLNVSPRKGSKQNDAERKSSEGCLDVFKYSKIQSCSKKREEAVTLSGDAESDESREKTSNLVKPCDKDSDVSDSSCTPISVSTSIDATQKHNTKQTATLQESEFGVVSDDGDDGDDGDNDEDLGDANDAASSSDSGNAFVKTEERGRDSSNDSDSDQRTNESRKRAQKPLASKQKRRKSDEGKVVVQKEKKQRRGKSSTSSDDSKAVARLKRLIHVAGLNRRYARLLADCKSEAARVRVLKGILEEAGLEGKPTLKSCKELKGKREEAAELADLDPSNIITPTGSGRPRRTSWYDTGREAERGSAASQKKTQSRFTILISSDESDSN